MSLQIAKHYLVASDFDQTLSFNDSGKVLSELIGASDFDRKVDGLSRCNLVQQGGELAYLIRHDPDFRGVRREHLVEAGKRVRLRNNIGALVDLLDRGVEGCRFAFVVISAAPREVIESALSGIVPPDRIFGTEFEYDEGSGEVRSIVRVRAGYGKVAVIEELETQLEIAPARTVYIGDGSSDVHVMLHVNNRDGFTIAVSDVKSIARIATRTVVSDNTLSILVPILEDVVGWDAPRIRGLFESYGLVLQEWHKARTDWVTFREETAAPGVELVS
jgi:phosphoserine phosphatase